MKEKYGQVKIIKIIANTVFYLVLAVSIFLSAMMVISKSKGQQPVILGKKFFIVLTGSMSPKIKVGDLIIVSKVMPDEVKTDDVITFTGNSSNIITTHRVKDIINKDGNIQYITKGDANNVEDSSPVDSSCLIGEVTHVLPKIGTYLLWIQKNMRQIIIGIISIVFIYLLFIILKGKYNVDKNRK